MSPKEPVATRSTRSGAAAAQGPPTSAAACAPPAPPAWLMQTPARRGAPSPPAAYSARGARRGGRGLQRRRSAASSCFCFGAFAFVFGRTRTRDIQQRHRGCRNAAPLMLRDARVQPEAAKCRWCADGCLRHHPSPELAAVCVLRAGCADSCTISPPRCAAAAHEGAAGADSSRRRRHARRARLNSL
jgi:hypothetical protein